MNITQICLLLLQLLAYAMGTISKKGYKSYKKSAPLTGNSLMLTTAPSAVRCLTLCAGYQHTSSEVCYAARYNGGTSECELISHSVPGEVQWMADNLWKVFVDQIWFKGTPPANLNYDVRRSHDLTIICDDGKEFTQREKYTVELGYCMAGWTRFRTSCYGVFTSTVTWSDAKTACAQDNALLVSITSVEEENYIQAMAFTYYAWLGAYRKEDRSYVWDSGESFSYQRFVDGYSFRETYYGCLTKEADNVYWTEHECSDFHQYVCEQQI
ncbi:SLA4-like protein [Mya arenaria]|uniref:SLA4-like protein n=1 Tax=Mya arenaria TaxID=6604 RepID=A0ABY7EVR7_MYAAR|nr:SLA4-like protein [Mya arenaria]